MIIGIGTDLADARRLEKMYARFGDRFLDRFLTTGEKSAVNRYTDKTAMINACARRFAAKEAGVKALGTGFRGGIRLTDLEISNTDNGAPVLSFHNKALDRLHAITPEGCTPVTHVSLTDEPPCALAFVVIEARPAP